MIYKSSSGSSAGLPFSLILTATGAGVTGRVWTDAGSGLTAELKVRLPGGSYTNATISRIIEIGGGNYEYQLTAAESANTGIVYYYVNLASHEGDILTARWDRIVEVSRGSLAQDARDLFREIRRATAQAGALSTITLDASASSITSIYNNYSITIVGGTGIGQSRKISAYNGTTKIATVSSNWLTIPDSSTVFMITAETAVDSASGIAAAVWALAAEGSYTYGDMIRAILSLNGCRVTDFTTGTLVFKSIDGTKTRWTAVVDSTGRLTATPGDLT